MTASADLVTTVVVTRDRWPDLRRSLPHHTGPVVLVDNASEDGTARLVRDGFPRVEVIELPENRGAAGRNAGVGAAVARFLADPALAAETGRAARRHVLERYGCKRFLDDWDRLLEAAVAGR